MDVQSVPVGSMSRENAGIIKHIKVSLKLKSKPGARILRPIVGIMSTVAQ